MDSAPLPAPPPTSSGPAPLPGAAGPPAPPPGPPAGPPTGLLNPVHQADGRRLAAVAAVGLVVLTLVPVDGVGLGTSLGVATTLAVLLLAPLRRANRVLLGVGFLATTLLTLRADPIGWGLVLAICTATSALAATTALRGSPLDQSATSLLVRAAEAVGHVVLGPAHLSPALRRAGRGAGGPRTRATLQGALVGVPIVLVLGALLADGDRLFDALVGSWDIAVPDLGGRMVLAAIAVLAAAGLLRAGATVAAADPAPPRRWIGATQAATTVWMVTALFVVFDVVQLAAALGVTDEALRQAGTTASAHAREGFFQLLAVAALTLLLLVVVRTWVVGAEVRPPAVLRVPVTACLAAVVVIVAVALLRLDAYNDAFGLTRLRLWSSAACVWIGGTFILLAVRTSGWRPRRRWVLPGALGWGIALVLALVAVGPDVLIASRNTDLAAEGHRLDVTYALTLSADATPTLVEALPRLHPVDAGPLRAGLCEDRPPAAAALAHNRSLTAASRALDTVC